MIGIGSAPQLRSFLARRTTMLRRSGPHCCIYSYPNSCRFLQLIPSSQNCLNQHDTLSGHEGRTALGAGEDYSSGARLAHFLPLLFFSGHLNVTPSVSPFTQANSQRRNANPVEDNSRKNSFIAKPWIDSSTPSFAPVSEISWIVQGRRHVPSMPIMFAAYPRSNTTRRDLRSSIRLIRHGCIDYSEPPATGRTQREKETC